MRKKCQNKKGRWIIETADRKFLKKYTKSLYTSRHKWADLITIMCNCVLYHINPLCIWLCTKMWLSARQKQVTTTIMVSIHCWLIEYWKISLQIKYDEICVNLLVLELDPLNKTCYYSHNDILDRNWGALLVHKPPWKQLKHDNLTW